MDSVESKSISPNTNKEQNTNDVSDDTKTMVPKHANYSLRPQTSDKTPSTKKRGKKKPSAHGTSLNSTAV